MGRRRMSPRLRANRSNSRKSTGPRTQSGKNKSAMNAIIHGLAAKNFSVPQCDPDVEKFARQLCGSDTTETSLCLAYKLVEAQFALNAVRAYKMILHRLHAAGKNSPLPASDLLTDPYIEEFYQYMLTDELDFWLGPKSKKDWRHFFRIQKALYRFAKTSRHPELEIPKLHRYEQLAIQKRQIAILQWDAYQSSKQAGHAMQFERCLTERSQNRLCF